MSIASLVPHLLTRSAGERRARRIKCDETQPVCKRCVIGNRPCRYALVTPSPSPPSAGSTPPAQALSRAPFYQAEPPGWDAAQAMRFCWSARTTATERDANLCSCRSVDTDVLQVSSRGKRLRRAIRPGIPRFRLSVPAGLHHDDDVPAHQAGVAQSQRPGETWPGPWHRALVGHFLRSNGRDNVPSQQAY